MYRLLRTTGENLSFYAERLSDLNLNCYRTKQRVRVTGLERICVLLWPARCSG